MTPVAVAVVALAGLIVCVATVLIERQLDRNAERQARRLAAAVEEERAADCWARCFVAYAGKRYYDPALCDEHFDLIGHQQLEEAR